MDTVDFFKLFVAVWVFVGIASALAIGLERIRRLHLPYRLWPYGVAARSRGWFLTSRLLVDACRRSFPLAIVRAETAMSLYYQGRVDEACRAIDDVPVFNDPSGVYSVHTVNMLVCVDVAAGRYSRALERRGAWSLGDCDGTILSINEAEALANLGRWEESLERARRCLEATGLERTGAALHHAWVLAQLDRASEARDMFALAREDELPIDFRSEYHYAEAFVLLAEGDSRAARRATLRGEALAIRASSRRNALFLLGRIAAREGLLEEALLHFESGARHAFRGQGGDGLLSWGDTLASMGRDKQAAEAWKLVLVRDPESYAATTARERLRAAADAA